MPNICSRCRQSTPEDAGVRGWNIIDGRWICAGCMTLDESRYLDEYFGEDQRAKAMYGVRVSFLARTGRHPTEDEVAQILDRMES